MLCPNQQRSFKLFSVFGSHQIKADANKGSRKSAKVQTLTLDDHRAVWLELCSGDVFRGLINSLSFNFFMFVLFIYFIYFCCCYRPVQDVIYALGKADIMRSTATFSEVSPRLLLKRFQCSSD